MSWQIKITPLYIFLFLILLLPFFVIRRGAGKSLAFPIFLFAAQPKEFFLDGLKKLEQRSHKCVESSMGNM
jgi:hypothetical protein